MRDAKNQEMLERMDKFSVRVSWRVRCAVAPHRFSPHAGSAGSHSCIWPERPCYLSMSHTGPATRLTLPPLLCNSTAPGRSSSSGFVSGRSEESGQGWGGALCVSQFGCVLFCIRHSRSAFPSPVCWLVRSALRRGFQGSMRSLRRQAAEWLQTGGASLDTWCRPANQRSPCGGRRGDGGRMEVAPC